MLINQFLMTFDSNTFKNFRYFNISSQKLANASRLIDWLGPSVEILDVSSNILGEFNASTFQRFENLKYLNLRDTNLTTIGAAILFKTHHKLETLILENNPFTRINCDFFTSSMNSSIIHVSDDIWDNITELDTSCLKTPFRWS